LLFTNALIKENPDQAYGLYTLTVPLKADADWKDAERRLLDAAKAECASFMDEASRQMKLLEQTNLLEAPSPEPRITIQLPEPGRIQLVLRFPAPDRGRSRIEQAILRRFLEGPRWPTGLRDHPMTKLVTWQEVLWMRRCFQLRTSRGSSKFHTTI